MTLEEQVPLRGSKKVVGKRGPCFYKTTPRQIFSNNFCRNNSIFNILEEWFYRITLPEMGGRVLKRQMWDYEPTKFDFQD